MNPDWQTLWTGKFLEIRRRNRWEYVSRTNAHSVVAIVAITQANELLLVEQYRLPILQSVIELPAGLAGDDPGTSGEPPFEAARRELLEETGYVSDDWTELMSGPSSAGLTDEVVVMFLARSASQQTNGGGVGGEDIILHRVPLNEVIPWLMAKQAAGAAIDFKVIAGIHFAQTMPHKPR